jgi:uncharacterized protein
MNRVTSSSRSMALLGGLAVVRLIGLGLVLVVTTIMATIATRMLVPSAPSPLHQWILLKNVLLPLLLLAAYAGTVRWLEHRRPSELALGRGVTLFPAGLMVGMTLISGYVLVLWMVGAAHVASGDVSGGLLRLLNEFLVPWLTAVGEELLFRAVLFRIAEEMFGTATAVLISAAVFALSHVANPGANSAALMSLAMGMGVLLALAFAATRNLWFPIGLHMGWNVAEGFLYGLPNSGLTDPLQVTHTSIDGASAITGGDFGPEGSIVLLALSVIMSAILLRMTLRGKRWIRMRFQMRDPSHHDEQAIRPPGHGT